MNYQRNAVRSATAAASGASTMEARLSAHSMRDGAHNELGPDTNGVTADTPKISTGT